MMNLQVTRTSFPVRRPLAAVPALLCLLAAGLTPAQAHPGHAWSEASPQHLLTSPDHLAALAVLGAVSWLGARWVQRRWPRRLLQLVGCVAVAASAILWARRA